MLGSLPACRGSSANAARREARTLRRSPRRFRRSVVVGYARIGGTSDEGKHPHTCGGVCFVVTSGGISNRMPFARRLRYPQSSYGISDHMSFVRRLRSFK